MIADETSIQTLQAEILSLRQRVADLEHKGQVLLDQESMLLQALDAVTEMVLIKGPQSRIVYANKAFRDLHGMTQEQLRDMIDAPFNEPDYTQQYIRDDAQVFDTGQTLEIDCEPVTRHDGAVRLVHSVKSAIRDAQGQVVQTVGVFEDITEQLQAEQLATLYREIVRHMPIGMMIFQLEVRDDPTSFRLIAANPGAKHFSGIDLEAEVGRPVLDVFPNGMESGLLPIYADVIRSGQARALGEMAYGDDRVDAGFFAIHALPVPDNCVCILFENVTERRRAEAALRQSIEQEETIRAQNAALAELSTPLIPLSEQVMVMPLIGSVDSRRAQQVIDSLLQGIATNHAQIAILDITGVPVVDTQVANALIRAAQSVKLLGAEVVLTGIRPEVAQTLVGLGTDLSGIVTRSSLQNGIAYATRQR